MALSPAARIQANSGTVTTAATSFTATLPNPTMDQSTLLLFFAAAPGAPVTPSVDPPWLLEQAHGGEWYAWRRDSQPAGETSWTVTSGLSMKWAWRVEEWGSLATAGQPDAKSTTKINVSALVCTTGDAGSGGAAIADVDDFAALALFRWDTSGAPGWPAGRSYSSGWSEVDYVAIGDGTGSTDFALALAESYPGAAGTVICTLTFDITGGGGAPSSTDGWAVCYQPAAPPPALGILAAP